MSQPSGRPTGLTSAQAEDRRRQGLGNDVKLSTSRSYKNIFLTNIFNPVNIVLYVIGFGMAAVGDLRSAFATVMLVVFNAVVGIIQEVRAKRQLDAIALLARAKINVLRDGDETAVDPGELVQGDVLVVRAGDQLPVDGTLVGDGKLEMDESALTGESDLVPKSAGDTVMSGSFCVTGATLVEATGVGESSFANELTKNAREFKLEQTPLQRDVNRLLRILLLIIAFYSLLSVLSFFLNDLPVTVWLQVMAVVTGSVSAGLLTLITLNYSWGSVTISREGALVQQINAVESLSNVSVLCTDKTGTLTANKIRYHDVYPVGMDADALKQVLGEFAVSASTGNKTSEALAEGLAATPRTPVDEVPFSSARKWSALAFDDAQGRGVYVLGALEMLQAHFDIDRDAVTQLKTWSDAGLRVLVFAGNPDVATLHDGAGEPVLPPLTLLGIVAFSDELRPHLQETLSAFTDNGVQLKVISGDNPQTVAALAKQAGLPGDLRAVSGPELAQMSPGEFRQTAKDATVFGRITPQQKEALVDALRSEGEYVAMMGDGVNDVLSLKKANLGIAMESGSSATRSVAAIVLLNDSFEAMPKALTEGQRTVNSIQKILMLFMVTVFALLLLIVATSALDVGFPFTTLQSTLLSFFARGAPPLILAVTALAVRRQISLMDNIMHFTMPAAISVFLFGLVVYLSIFYIAQSHFVAMDVTPEKMSTLQGYTGGMVSQMTPEVFRLTGTQLS
ncbi:MAG: HAD-IC family P-type ATPase [Caldilineaceae bacterium]